MNANLGAASALFLSLGALSAHVVEVYLQATMISVDKDRVQLSMRLVPGVAVFPVVFASIDTNRDGAISERERRAYVERVLRDVSLTIDGSRLTPRIVSVDFPAIEAMKGGLGEIKIELVAELPSGGPHRKLVLENHHQSAIAAYLVNCLVPRDRDIRVIAQNRNETQSFYELDYDQAVAL